MKLDFDIENVTVVEFGVGRDDGNEQTFVAIPADAKVQATLREMVRATWRAMQDHEEGPSKYDPSEKHGGTEYLYLSLSDGLVTAIRELHVATNLSIDIGALSDPAHVFCYFARLTDKRNRRLTAMRRATQFKGILKSKNRLVRMLDDTLQIIEDEVFKLDNDFDLLVDGANVHILRPSGFEFMAKLREAILGAVPENVREIQQELPFVALDSIAEYAAKHPRAARLLASVRSYAAIRNIDKSLLKKLCRQTGVEVRESKGKIIVEQGHEMGFLEVLDRRRYEVSLVKGKPERYRAASRRKIDD
jgi:hypothetical protein